MPRPNRRIYEKRVDVVDRAAIQAVRQAGSFSPWKRAKWGFITGDLDDQEDLRKRTDDLESKAVLGDDGS